MFYHVFFHNILYEIFQGVKNRDSNVIFINCELEEVFSGLALKSDWESPMFELPVVRIKYSYFKPISTQIKHDFQAAALFTAINRQFLENSRRAEKEAM